MNTQAMRDVKIALDEMEYRGSLYWDACLEKGFDRVKRSKFYLEYREAIENYESRRDTARSEWAQLRRWRYSAKKWRHHYPCVDHAEVFVDASGREVGTLSHTYACRSEIEAYAAQRGLCATFLDESWYAPGKATAVLFTKAARS